MRNVDSRRKITVNPDVLTSDILKDDDEKSVDSLDKSDVLSPLDDLATPDDIDTPDDLDDDLFDSMNILIVFVIIHSGQFRIVNLLLMYLLHRIQFIS